MAEFGRLNILCWEGYDDAAMLARFRDVTGGAVAAETFLSDHEAIGRVLARPGRWDLINVNSPFVAGVLHPRGRIHVPDAKRLGPLIRDVLPQFRELYACGFDPGGTALGVCQRFGPFNLVVNTDRISPALAADQGFALVQDPANRGRFGVLAYDDFNVQHIAIGAGIDPFVPLDEPAFARFAATAHHWFSAAGVVTDDHHRLNAALVRNEIDFYLSGGIYTASSARLAGHRQVRAVTPTSGPLGGKGGIAFVEVTAILAETAAPHLAEAFLAFMLEPETSVRAALSAGAANPVAQMSSPAVLGAFTAEQLDAMQWDTLEEEVARCAPYRLIPDYDRLHALLLRERGALRGP